jgi:hypothetical protein
MRTKITDIALLAAVIPGVDKDFQIVEERLKISFEESC